VNDADNNRFDIFDYDLAVKRSLTEKRDYRIYVRITDNAQRVYAKEFTVAPGELPLPPTALYIDDEMVTVLEQERAITGSDNYNLSDGSATGLVTVFCSTRTVTLVPYSMAKYTVTYGQWHEVVQWATADERGDDRYTFINAGQPGGVAPSAGAGGQPTNEEKYLPVTTISWRDAMVWCNALSEYTDKEPVYYYSESDGGGVARTSSADAVVAADITTKSNLDAAKFKIDRVEMDKTKNGYRLPTEAEWEFAARNGTIPATVPESIPEDADYMWQYAGTNEAALLGDYAWFGSNSDKIQAVGKKKPNKLGLYDMTGNVSELCWDWYIEGTIYANRRYTDVSIGSDGGTWAQKKVNVSSAGNYARATRNGGRASATSINKYARHLPSSAMVADSFRIACTVTP
jgi:formylglycine-generating enzyme required for sulfatase activity